MHGVGPKISGQIVWFKTVAIKLQSQTKKLSGENLTAFLIYGAGKRNRTLDLLITSELLYQLSYSGIQTQRPKTSTTDRIINDL